MALKMLAAYYSCGCDSEELFRGFRIEKEETFKEYLNRYDVIYLNMQQFLIEADAGKETEYLEQEVLEELYEEYGEILANRNVGLAAALRKIFVKTDRQFIFLIDEWDCVMRERQESEALQKQYLDFLRNLLKDQPYVALAYMTGILPVKKYGQHSALNMFWEYSMTNQYVFEEYTGFTEEEVKGLCERFGMDFAKTGSWYDGYRFSKWKHIYNPRSVVAAMSCQDFSSYWTSTETYEALKIYMDMDFDGLRSDIVQMLGGLAYYSARKDYRLIRELPTGCGFADIVFLPLPSVNKPALVVGLKYDKSAWSAIQQIKDRHYTKALEGYAGEILLVGINYDKNKADKPHSCVIEKVEKPYDWSEGCRLG